MNHTLRHLGRFTGTIVLLSGALSSLGAQQANQPDEGRPTKANWALANRFSAAALRPITYTAGVQPRFLGQSDSMWYNWRDRNGSRFILFVPSATGQ